MMDTGKHRDHGDDGGFGMVWEYGRVGVLCAFSFPPLFLVASNPGRSFLFLFSSSLSSSFFTTVPPSLRRLLGSKPRSRVDTDNHTDVYRHGREHVREYVQYREDSAEQCGLSVSLSLRTGPSLRR